MNFSVFCHATEGVGQKPKETPAPKSHDTTPFDRTHTLPLQIHTLAVLLNLSAPLEPESSEDGALQAPCHPGDRFAIGQVQEEPFQDPSKPRVSSREDEPVGTWSKAPTGPGLSGTIQTHHPFDGVVERAGIAKVSPSRSTARCRPEGLGPAMISIYPVGPPGIHHLHSRHSRVTNHASALAMSRLALGLSR